MRRWLCVEMPDGVSYYLDTQKLAARLAAIVKDEPRRETTWERLLNDDAYLAQASRRLEWSDVRDIAHLTPFPFGTFDYATAWKTAEREVIEVGATG